MESNRLFATRTRVTFNHCNRDFIFPWRIFAAFLRNRLLSCSLTLHIATIRRRLSYANKGVACCRRKDCRLIATLFRFTRGRSLAAVVQRGGMIIFLYRPRCHGVGSKKQDDDITHEPAPVTGVVGQTCHGAQTHVRVHSDRSHKGLHAVPPTDNNYGRG